MCYIIDITHRIFFVIYEYKGSEAMIIEIDFNSNEALYIQLRNQIILGIANSKISEGESLPSVRDLAEDIGINMHTVNKAYALLKQEGYLRLDRRSGAVICVDADKYKARQELMEQLIVTLAKGACKGVTRQEVHKAVDEIFDSFQL